MTHAELVQRAVRWLRGRHRCVVVFAEMSSLLVSERPDAIGWTNRGHCVVVECKTSLSDFRADRDKPHVRGGRSMGAERWYLAPWAVLGAHMMPPGVGLAEIRRGRQRVIVTREPMPGVGPRHVDGELRLLVAAAQRHELGVRFDTSAARWEPMLIAEQRREKARRSGA